MYRCHLLYKEEFKQLKRRKHSLGKSKSLNYSDVLRLGSHDSKCAINLVVDTRA